MQASFWTQYMLLIRQGLKAELSDKERLVSPILFAVTVLLLFSFALGDVDKSLMAQVFVAELFLTALFALQLTFARIFEPDRLDRVFDLMRTYPISPTAWFLAKFSLVVVLGACVLLPTILFAGFLHNSATTSFISWTMVAISLLALVGLAALGVLLSVMTLGSSSRQLLYPLIYFPLTAPVLLAAVQSSLIYMEAGTVTDTVQSWLGLLLAFDVIYFTLGILLFPELLEGH